METTLALYDKNLISARKVLEVADMEDQVEETEMRLREQEIKNEQMMNFQQNVFANSVQQTDKVQQKRMQLLEKMEGELAGIKGNIKPTNNFQNGNGKLKKPTASFYKTADIVNSINDPEIKDLYKEYLRTKTNLYKDIDISDNNNEEEQ